MNILGKLFGAADKGNRAYSAAIELSGILRPDAENREARFMNWLERTGPETSGMDDLSRGMVIGALMGHVNSAYGDEPVQPNFGSIASHYLKAAIEKTPLTHESPLMLAVQKCKGGQTPPANKPASP